jgi:hypothetical protein
MAALAVPIMTWTFGPANVMIETLGIIAWCENGCADIYRSEDMDGMLLFLFSLTHIAM